MGSSDAPAALVMGVGMLGFGLTMILRPNFVIPTGRDDRVGGV
jgi:hypothetical protein